MIVCFAQVTICGFIFSSLCYYQNSTDLQKHFNDFKKSKYIIKPCSDSATSSISDVVLLFGPPLHSSSFIVLKNSDLLNVPILEKS